MLAGVERFRPARRRWILATGAVVAAAGLATIGVRPRLSLGTRAAIDGALVATSLSGAAVAFVRYRSTVDPGPVFVSAGLAAIGVQTVLFDQRWLFAGGFWPKEETAAFGWFAAWLLASVGFLLARPWWERRGRRPIRAPLVFGVTAGALVLIDIALVALRHELPQVKSFDLRSGGIFEHTSLALAVLGFAAIGMLGVAAWREATARKDARSPDPWLALAWTVAAAAQVVLLARPVPLRPLVVPADVLPVVAAGAALVAYLAPQAAEASRARRATDRAQEVMGGRAEIAAMIAHEVRGPVTTIRGLAGTAIAHYERLGDAERRELLELIDQESRRLLATVTQASTALKVDASTLHYDIRRQDVGRTVHEGVEAAGLGDRPVTVDVPEGVQIPLDRRWLAEAVRQLVDNAAKFSPAETSIRVAVHADDPWVTIEISDRGPGIPREQRDRVFEKFAAWRPDGYEGPMGTGLGLFMVRGIVRAHGGEISIVDAPEGGTMLRVRLPTGG